MSGKKDLLDDILGPSQAGVDFDPETFKKILEMNPELLGNKTPEAFLSELKNKSDKVTKQKNELEKLKDNTQSSMALPTDLDALAIYLEKKYQIEKKEIEDEIKKLNERQRSLKPRYKDVFMERLLEIDPNMVSPKTGFVLKDKKTWLDEIGFTIEDFISLGRKRK